MSQKVIAYLAWHHPAAPGGSAVPPNRVEMPSGGEPEEPTAAAMACWHAAWTEALWRAAGRSQADDDGADGEPGDVPG
jgi:hypothetical protein